MRRCIRRRSTGPTNIRGVARFANPPSPRIRLKRLENCLALFALMPSAARRSAGRLIQAHLVGKALVGEPQEVGPSRLSIARRRSRLLDRVQGLDDGVIVQDVFGEVDKRPVRREGRSQRLPERLFSIRRFQTATAASLAFSPTTASAAQPFVMALKFSPHSPPAPWPHRACLRR